MWLFTVTAGLAASPWAEANADIQVQRTLDAAPEALVAQLDTTAKLADLLAGCTEDWEHGPDARGPARVSYRIKSFKRRLTARVSVVEPRRVELDHEGRKGFVTRFALVPQGPQTEVTLTTWLTAPGWPVRKYYFEAVQPGWQDCYAQALTRLEAAARAHAPEPPETP